MHAFVWIYLFTFVLYFLNPTQLHCDKNIVRSLIVFYKIQPRYVKYYNGKLFFKKKIIYARVSHLLIYETIGHVFTMIQVYPQSL